MSDQSSSSNDWALVTHEGDVEDESEDDGSCSGSSIEMLTSDEDIDVVTSSHGNTISDSGRDPAGPFFVLRLRSNKFLAESDSDEKDALVKSVSKGQGSSTSSQSGEMTEPELLRPVSTDDETNDNQEVSKTELKETIISPNSAEETTVEQEEDNIETNTCSSVHMEPVAKKTVAVEQISSGISSSLDFGTGTVKDDKDNTSFPSLSGSTSSAFSEEIIPDVLLNVLQAVETETENQSINIVTEKDPTPTEDTENVNGQLLADEQDLHTRDDLGSETSSLGSSNFSLLNETECSKGEIEVIRDDVIDNVKVDNEEDEFLILEYGNSTDLDNEHDKIILLEQQDNMAADEAGKNINMQLDEGPPMVDRMSEQPKHKRNASFEVKVGILEAISFMIIGIAGFWLGCYYGDSPSQELWNQWKDTRNQLDVFHTHFAKMKNWKDDFDKKAFEPENIDWRNYFSVDLKESRFQIESSRNLDNELNKYENYMADLLMNTINRVKGDKQAEINEAREKLKDEVNILKKENVDLKNEIIENGKRKYLLDELEDENLALIKRISDIESQLMEAQDQSYVLNLQISKLEKKMDARLSNDEDGGTLLKKRLGEMEKEKKYFENQIGDHENTIARYEIENERKSRELLEAESWKVENVELKRKWGVLSVKVQHLEAELNNAHNKIHELRSLPEEQAKDAMVTADKKRLEEKNKELQSKLADLEKEHGILFQNYDKSSEDNLDESHDLDDTDDYEDEGIDIESADEDIDAVDTEQEVSKKNEHKAKKYQKPDRWTLGKIIPEKLKAEREKEKHQSGNNEGRKSWSDAMNEILNKTKISMVNVSRQIQDTLSQVKNLSEELWKKHEPQVNQVITTTFKMAKASVSMASEIIADTASNILEKSENLIRMYQKSRKNKRRRRKQNDDDGSKDTFTASTSRRQYKNGQNHDNHHDHDHNHDHKYKQYNEDEDFGFRKSDHADNYPGFLENELQSLRDSVEYVNTLQGLKCNELVDIMEDFQDFKKSGGNNILSENENLWFFCQKSWFENMVYSDPSVDSECRDKLVRRQLAAVDYRCCPCLGNYRSSGVFCDLGDGCNHQSPKEKKSKKKRSYKGDTKVDPQLDKNKIDEVEQNETAEEQMTMSRGKFIYCDPFSQDLDCGDESWYLKRMKDREHLRKYRTSSKTDWMFNRADDREYHRTQPDDWYFKRMGGGQAYETYQDDNWHDAENWYIKKINYNEKNRRHDDESNDL